MLAVLVFHFINGGLLFVNFGLNNIIVGVALDAGFFVRACDWAEEALLELSLLNRSLVYKGPRHFVVRAQRHAGAVHCHCVYPSLRSSYPRHLLTLGLLVLVTVESDGFLLQGGVRHAVVIFLHFFRLLLVGGLHDLRWGLWGWLVGVLLDHSWPGTELMQQGLLVKTLFQLHLNHASNNWLVSFRFAYVFFNILPGYFWICQIGPSCIRRAVPLPNYFILLYLFYLQLVLLGLEKWLVLGLDCLDLDIIFRGLSILHVEVRANYLSTLKLSSFLGNRLRS